MEKMSGEQLLLKIQADITSSRYEYQLPWPLFTLVNEEYLGYLKNTNGGNYYYQWLALLVKTVRPNLILELGSAFGLSALMMFSELSETARLISCDLVKQLDFVPSHVFNDPRLRFCFGNDLNLNIFNDDLPIGIDILFIDTAHTFSQVSAEWNIYQHLCNPGAIVVLDDIRMNDMFNFWESLPYPKLELTQECHVSGFGIFSYTPGNNPNALSAYREALRIAIERRGNAQSVQITQKSSILSIWEEVKRNFPLSR